MTLNESLRKITGHCTPASSPVATFPYFIFPATLFPFTYGKYSSLIIALLPNEL